MSIDWFTFAAQIVNFLILVGLLRYFLYGPIVRAMDQRERKVAQRLTDADAAKSAAEQQREALQAQTAAIQQQRDAMIAEAQEAAETRRQQLLSEAKSEIESQRQQWTEAFEQDKTSLAERTRDEIERMGFDAARRTLRQLADTELQRQFCESFVRQLNTLEEERKNEIAMQLSDSGDEILVRSAMPLGPSEQDRLRVAIAETFHCDTALRFETDESLVCGLAVDAGGYSLNWNAAGTLSEMEVGLTQ